LYSVLYKVTEVWRIQRLCDKNRTRARARYLAKLNTKGFYTEIGGGEVQQDMKVSVLMDEVPFVCVVLTKSTYKPYPKPYPPQ
jgi:hypothetical protein